jgi:hypothetical protein
LSSGIEILPRVSPVLSGRKTRFLAGLAASLTLLVAAFAVAGCGETVIDDVKIEEQFKSDLAKSLHVKIKTVDCPSDQKVEAGKTFTCTVTFSDGKQEIATLKILNKEADVGFVGLKPKK